MAITLDQSAAFVSSSQCSSEVKAYHENLITDHLLARALQAILDGISADGLIQARQIREKAGFTLTEAIQAVRYLHRQGVLGEEMGGNRTVNRAQALDYLEILVPREVLTQTPVSEETHSFSQAQIAWACMHAQENKLTPMRVARPSKWTIALAQALGLMEARTAGELLMSTGRAQHLCRFVMDEMSLEARASSVRWAEAKLSAKEEA